MKWSNFPDEPQCLSEGHGLSGQIECQHRMETASGTGAAIDGFGSDSDRVAVCDGHHWNPGFLDAGADGEGVAQSQGRCWVRAGRRYRGAHYPGNTREIYGLPSRSPGPRDTFSESLYSKLFLGCEGRTLAPSEVRYLSTFCRAITANGDHFGNGRIVSHRRHRSGLAFD